MCVEKSEELTGIREKSKRRYCEREVKHYIEFEKGAIIARCC